MPQILKHRKPKKATVLISRAVCLKNYVNYKSYKPLCDKLKVNNNSLAKALSKEKQNCQQLFADNVALGAELQDLNAACNKRDAVISNMLMNGPEIVKMLIKVTEYVAKTIQSCQEFATSSTVNLQMAYNSTGKRESIRQLSTKSPARGVVKPMVSGHTITKPTINLSRVNMRRVNNPSGLGVIEEVSASPARSPELNSPRSPVAVSITRHRFEGGRTCRMPERITAASQRTSDANEARLSKRINRLSGRISGKHLRSKSVRLSGPNESAYGGDYVEHIGSPRVKLNDVSKLLQNSQSINIRMLTENETERVDDTRVNSNNANLVDSSADIAIPETPSEGSQDENDTTAEHIENESGNESSNRSLAESSNEQQNTSDWEDPLEGPSWLFENAETVLSAESNPAETDKVKDCSNNRLCTTLSKVSTLSAPSNGTKYTEQTSSLPALTNRTRITDNSRSADSADNEEQSFILSPEPDRNNLCNIHTSAELGKVASDSGSNVGVRFPTFVTQRRDYNDVLEDDTDDFTLMYKPQPRNMNFDLNDLKLPVLEESALPPTVAHEPEPELTANIQKLPQTWPIPSVWNNGLDDSAFNQSTVKLPFLLNNDYEEGASPLLNRQSELEKPSTKKQKMNAGHSVNIDEGSELKNGNEKQKKRGRPRKKDPSAAKVVLQKLNESDVKQRIPSPEEMFSQDSSIHPTTPVSWRHDNSSDSESSNASTSERYATKHPRRKRAPFNFQEPSLRQKLRRNF